jgi:hypothetical protein
MRLPRAAVVAAVAAALAVLTGSCRSRPTSVRDSGPSAPDERDQLLARIRALPDVEPCLADGGAAGVRLVDADLAGEAAGATFSCDNGAASGKVTFFRVGGAWTVSTKQIARRAPVGR